MKERHQIAFKLISTHIIPLSGMLLLSFIFRNDGFLLITISQTALLIILFAGYWEFFGVRFKWIFFASAELFIFVSLLNRFISWKTEIPAIFWFALMVIIQMYLLWLFGKIILVVLKNDPASLEIEFPFKHGSYLVTDGGNSKISRMMNYHFHSPVHQKKNTNQSMLYATDIVKIDTKRKLFIALKNEEYLIYNEEIYSPMGGHILKVVNDIDDNLPFSGNYPYNTGNTVVINKGNLYYLLGHLKKGSVVVKPGDIVKSMDFLEMVGNSGMSERPHLHMQLMHCENDNYWSGMGIGLKYKNRGLYKNRLLKA